jgi:hypothetical protein
METPRPANGLRGCGDHDRFGNAGVSNPHSPDSVLNFGAAFAIQI